MSVQFKHILAIDTATTLCAAALRTPKGKTSRAEIIRGKHSSLIFSQISALLNEEGLQITDLDAIVLSGGPGSYTGLRVGASAVKGLLFGHRIPFFAASTLASFAMGAVPEGATDPVRVLAVIDARRSHVYARSFEIDKQYCRALTTDQIVAIDDLPQFGGKHHILTGTGLDRLPAAFLQQHHVESIEKSGAAGLLRLFELRKAEDAPPLIRLADPETWEPDYVSGSTWNHAAQSANSA